MEKENLVGDLDLLLDEHPESPEHTSESKEIISNIDIISEEKESQNKKLRFPVEILNDYTDKQKKIDSIHEEIEKFKKEHEDIFSKLETLEGSILEIQEQQDVLKDEMTESMGNTDSKKVSNDYFNFTYVAPTTRANFDKKSFEKKYPVLYKEFITTSDVKAYVKVTSLR